MFPLHNKWMKLQPKNKLKTFNINTHFKVDKIWNILNSNCIGIVIFINVKTCQLFQLFVSDLSESEASPFKHKCTNCSKKEKYRFIKGLTDDPECFKLIDQYIFPLIFYLYHEEAAYYDGSPISCCIELTFRHELCHCTFYWWCLTVSSLGCNNAILRQLEFSFRTKVNFS